MFVGPVNSARDPLLVPFQINVRTFKVLVGLVHCARDLLAGLCPMWNQLLVKKKKNKKKEETWKLKT